MKKIIYLMAALMIFTNARSADHNTPYPIAVNFNSICCGVPDSKPLFDMIKTFKKKNKIKTISYDRIGPLGKEGEYRLGFPLTELTKKQKTSFIAAIQKCVPTIKTPNSTSSGNAVVELNSEKVQAEGRTTIVREKI
jgi:hypothetical protein